MERVVQDVGKGLVDSARHGIGSAGFLRGSAGPGKRKGTLTVIALVILVSGLFMHSVAIRRPWIGTMYSSNHLHPTMKTVFFARHWYASGAMNLRFASVQNIRSVETENYFPNWFYVSMPPGYLIPVHVLARITGRAPGIAGVMKLNLFFHLVCSLLLALGMYRLLVRTGTPIRSAMVLAVIPALLFLFSRGAMWYMFAVYYGTQPGVFWFVVFFFLEVFRRDVESAAGRRVVTGLQYLVVFAGVLTDYLFLFVVLVAYVIRLTDGEFSWKPRRFIRKSLSFWSPAILGGLLFLIQLVSLDALPKLISRGKVRAGLSGGVDFWVSRFWNQHLPGGFGKAGRLMVLFSIVFVAVWILGSAVNRLWKKKPFDPQAGRLLSMASLALFPQVLYVFALRDAHARHAYFILPLGITLAVVPLVIIPTLVSLGLRGKLSRFAARWSGGNPAAPARGKSPGLSLVPAVLLLAAAVWYAVAENGRMGAVFSPGNSAAASAGHEKVYRFLGKHTGYADVVFSPTLEAWYRNPALQVLTGNNIYRLYSAHDIYYRVRYIRSPFKVCIVLDKRYERPSWLPPVLAGATVAGNDEIEVFRRDGREFLETYERLYQPVDFRAYLRAWQAFQADRARLDQMLAKGDLAGALPALQGMLNFLEIHDALAFNTRYLVAELAILYRLNRGEAAAEPLAMLRRFAVFPEQHMIWGWYPDPHILNLTFSDPTTKKIMTRGAGH